MVSLRKTNTDECEENEKIDNKGTWKILITLIAEWL